MERITSLQNERVKAAVKLRDRKGRDKQSRIAIDGTREIRRAFDAGVEFQEVFTCESLISTPESQELLSQINEQRLNRFEVTETVWDKLAFGNRRDGLFVVAKGPTKSLDDIPSRNNAFIVVLDGVEKPGNIGAVIRTADGAGADAVILTNAGTDTYNPNAIRASLGTIFCLPVVSAGIQETVAWLQAQKIGIQLAIVNDATVSYTECDFCCSTAVVFGSEANGIHEQWTTYQDCQAMHLPMRGQADSLNVSAATAAVLYEIVRQRNDA